VWETPIWTPPPAGRRKGRGPVARQADRGTLGWNVPRPVADGRPLGLLPGSRAGARGSRCRGAERKDAPRATGGRRWPDSPWPRSARPGRWSVPEHGRGQVLVVDDDVPGSCPSLVRGLGHHLGAGPASALSTIRGGPPPGLPPRSGRRSKATAGLTRSWCRGRPGVDRPRGPAWARGGLGWALAVASWNLRRRKRVRRPLGPPPALLRRPGPGGGDGPGVRSTAFCAQRLPVVRRRGSAVAPDLPAEGLDRRRPVAPGPDDCRAAPRARPCRPACGRGPGRSPSAMRPASSTAASVVAGGPSRRGRLGLLPLGRVLGLLCARTVQRPSLLLARPAGPPPRPGPAGIAPDRLGRPVTPGPAPRKRSGRARGGPSPSSAAPPASSPPTKGPPTSGPRSPPGPWNPEGGARVRLEVGSGSGQRGMMFRARNSARGGRRRWKTSWSFVSMLSWRLREADLPFPGAAQPVSMRCRMLRPQAVEPSRTTRVSPSGGVRGPDRAPGRAATGTTRPCPLKSFFAAGARFKGVGSGDRGFARGSRRVP